MKQDKMARSLLLQAQRIHKRLCVLSGEMEIQKKLYRIVKIQLEIIEGKHKEYQVCRKPRKQVV